MSGHPGLAEFAVVGVPDAQWGEVGVCVLVAAPGEAVAPEAVHSHLADRLARYKLPRRYVLLKPCRGPDPARSRRPSCGAGSTKADRIGPNAALYDDRASSGEGATVSGRRRPGRGYLE